MTNTTTLFFTAMEVLGAIVWLYFVRNSQPEVSAVVIFVGLAIEPVIEVTEGNPGSPSPGGPLVISNQLAVSVVWHPAGFVLLTNYLTKYEKLKI